MPYVKFFSSLFLSENKKNRRGFVWQPPPAGPKEEIPHEEEDSICIVEGRAPRRQINGEADYSDTNLLIATESAHRGFDQVADEV